jgi:glycosyltransferase involved in cell wall biosynthesis
MRFAILGSRGYPSSYGGYETLVRHLAPHLVNAGHEVTVYCRAQDEGRRTWSTDGVRCIAPPGIENKSLSTLSFGLTATIDASFRRFDAVLVLNIANGFWFPALRMTRTPFAVNTDGIEWERGKWSRLGRATFRAGARMTARHASTLICDSQAIAAIWKELFDRDSSFIPYGAPVLDDVGSDQLEPLGLSGQPFVLVVARLVPENNVELTLDALDLLGENAPRAVIVGSANFDSPIEARLKASEHAQRVQWLGHVDDQELLNQLWGNCAVYVHGHSVGGTNPSLLQAMGAGAPTLALDTSFNAEVLPYPEHRFPPDAEFLASRIREIVSSPTLQEEMAQRGRTITRERYDWNDVCDAYMQLLVSLAKHKRPTHNGGASSSSAQHAADAQPVGGEQHHRTRDEADISDRLASVAAAGAHASKDA